MIRNETTCCWCGSKIVSKNIYADGNKVIKTFECPVCHDRFAKTYLRIETRNIDGSLRQIKDIEVPT